MKFLLRACLWVFGSAVATTLMMPLSVFANYATCSDGVNTNNCTVPTGATSVLIEA